MKKIISVLLIFATIISCAATLIISVSASQYDHANILVDFNGIEFSADAFETADGMMLLSVVDVFELFDGLKCKKKGNTYIYSESGSTDTDIFEKQIHIDANTLYVKSMLQVPGKGLIEGNKFQCSKSYTHNGVLYLPLEEILPLIDAKIEVKEDKILHVYPYTVSIFDAINCFSLNNVQNIAFDSNDIIGGEVMGALSLIVDTITNGKIIERFDFIFNTGEINDYKALFERLLRENKTYLSVFDEDKHPYVKQHDELTTRFKYIKNGTSFTDNRLNDMEKWLKYLTDSKNFEYLEEFSDLVGEIEIWGDVTKEVYNVLSCSNAILHSVDDHKKMLGAVYNNRNIKKTPAKTAANEITAMYEGDTSKVITNFMKSFFSETVIGLVEKKVLGDLKPITIAFDALEKVLPELGELHEDYDIFYLDVIVSNSCDAATEYYEKITFDTKSLENIRLSLLSAMISSQYAYNTLSAFSMTTNSSDLRYDSTVNQKRLKINQWIEKLYLASDSAECYSKEYYDKTKDRLKSTVGYLLEGTSELYSNITFEAFEKTPDTMHEWIQPGWYIYYSGESEYEAETVKEIIIPGEYQGKPVTVIGEAGFAGLSSLERIVIPDSVSLILDCAFTSCDSLKSVVLPDYVVLFDGPFQNCPALETVSLGVHTFIAGYRTFANCPNLKYITFRGTSEQWYEVEHDSENSWNCPIRCTDKTIYP